MNQTNTRPTARAPGLANWILLLAAAIAWIGIVIHLSIHLGGGADDIATPLKLVAVGSVLLGILSGIANVSYYTRTESLGWQWLLIGIQIIAGLVSLSASELNSPAMMLIIGMAQVPARTGAVVTGVVFVATNIALGSVLMRVASTTAQALVVWFLFVGFQLFALTVAVLRQRERLSRESLAAVNAELVATRGLVANSARTEERLRVSRELHDIAGHTLTAIKVRLEAHSRNAPDELKAGLLATQDLAQKLLDDVRAVVSHLRAQDPASVQDALREMCDLNPGATMHLSIDQELRLDRADQVNAVLRVVQEATTNAVRHGAARNIWITLNAIESSVDLSVRDDGTGGTEYEPGNGLRGIEERLVALGGRLTVKPSASDGWTLEMHLPMSANPMGQPVQ